MTANLPAPKFTREMCFQAMGMEALREGTEFRFFQNSVGYEGDNVVFVTIKFNRDGGEKPTHQASFNAYGVSVFALTANYVAENPANLKEDFFTLMEPS